MSAIASAGYDPLDPEQLSDVHAHYARLRRESPVAWLDSLHTLMIMRDENVREVMLNNQVFSNEGTSDTGFGDIKVLVTADEPLHGRQRRLLNLAFTPRRVGALEPFMEEHVDALIDNVIDEGKCDLISSFALLVPAAVISKMMGVPPEDVDKFHKWAMDGIRASANPDKYLAEAQKSAMELGGYIATEAAKRVEAIKAGEPRDDLLTALMTAEIDGVRFNEQEIFFISWQLLTAGHETTATLIGNFVDLMSRYPDQKAKLMADPGLLEQAIEETLRFAPPAHAMPRRCAQPTEVAGVPIEEGQLVSVMLASANRDPDKWENPDSFDITRPLNTTRKHISFGYGVHLCLGAQLARLEARVALGKLLSRMPDIAVDPAGVAEPELGHFTRGWKRLDVRWKPPAEKR